MKKAWLLILILSITSCTTSIRQVLEQTKNNLTSEEALAYDVNQLLIQGNPSTGDTTFVKTTTHAIFEYAINDSLLAYKYRIEDRLVHPIFKIPVCFKNYYDGHQHVFVLESDVKNIKKVTSQPEIKLSDLERNTEGQIPTILKILNEDGFCLVNQTDTIFDDKKSLYINAISDDSIPHQLIIDKETYLPVRLKIIESSSQPYIYEYSYYNFKELLAFQEPSFVSDKVVNTVDLKALTIGSVIPEWNLQFVDNQKISTSDFKGKNTILFLSAINCGWCQKAIPSISRIQQKYMDNANIQTFVFYPIDTKEKLEAYIKAKKIDYPIIYNPCENKNDRMLIIDRLKFSYPTTVFLNSNNEIVWYKTGYSEDLEKEIERALKNSAHNKS